MNTFNAAMNELFDALFGPLSSLPPLVPLAFISALVGIGAALLFRVASNQAALKRAAGRSRAAVLAIRLFPEDVAGIWRNVGVVFLQSARRILHSLPVLLLMLPPLLLLLAQLAARYEFRPLQKGESVLVVAIVSEDELTWMEAKELQLQPSEGVVVETPALRDPAEGSVSWRVGVREPGRHIITLKTAGHGFEKSLTAAGKDALEPVSPLRPGRGFWSRLLYPREKALPSGALLQEIQVHYPRRSTPLLGADPPWWVTLLMISILAALTVRPFLRLQF